MNNKESSINYKRVISSIHMCINYKLHGGCYVSNDCLFNLHTSNAIYVHFEFANTEEYPIDHKRICYKYSEEDTEEKNKLIKELNLYKLENKFNIFEKNFKEINDISYQKIIEYVLEEYMTKEKEFYNELVEKEKTILEDSSAIIIRYTNGDTIKISFEYLSKDLIEKISQIINNKHEKYEDISTDEIIKTPLLRFEKKHELEIKYLEKIKMAYYNLNFNKVFDLVHDNCFKMSVSPKDTYNTLIGKKEIVENYKNLVKIAKNNNLIYQGCIYGELTEENEPILALHLEGREKNNCNNVDRKRVFSLSIRIDDDNLIHEINIRDEEAYAGKYLDDKAIEKVKLGTYSDFSDDFRVNNRIFNDEEIEFLLNFKDKYFKNQKEINLIDIETKMKEFYSDFSYSYYRDTKNQLIIDILATSGMVEYNEPNLICLDCGCKYISILGGGYLRKKKEGEIENKNHALKRYAYGCIITEYEYLHQCLGCGKEW
jgi:hypothetical protein